ncbi:glycosyltransferase [Microbacterium sp. zg-YB36]|uniref:glycosyltransferase n=1 Tax=Microbacterium sp. zg-YB36 TaxID=2969407 RepID=UPI00214CC42B|nr:glycosyltransferase [Microbacterium sp. zg-YB36]MDL5352323.1 glycosyltransferase [Microbacterium sp. zg-YB36]
MRIAQIVTYLSPDGAFGGPTRVAEAQCAALAAAGHDVTLWAAAPLPGATHDAVDGYERRLFPARRCFDSLGFAGMRAVGLTTALKADAAAIDAAHVHLARDLVTLPAAAMLLRAGVPLFVQTHGMIDRSSNPLSVPIDAMYTRPILRSARAVYTLTGREDRDVSSVEPQATLKRIRNGVVIPLSAATPPAREDTVLFMARLHERKRPVAFIEMAAILSAEFPDLRYVLAGPDEGELAAVQSAASRSGLGDRLSIVGAVSPSETDEFLANARVFVLPSVGEVFPMTVLEAFRAETPVVVTESLGIAEMCLQYGAAAVTNGSPEGLAAAVAGLLRDEDRARAMVAGAKTYLHAELNIAVVAESLSADYAGAADG